MKPRFHARLWTLWGVSLVLVFAWSAQCQPVTFERALELALNHNGAERPAAPSAVREVGERSCPVPLENFAALAAQLDSVNEMGLPAGGLDFPSVPLEELATSFALRSKHDVLLCTALLFVRLEDIEARRRLVRKQEELARRLMDIELRRVSVEVDHPLQLIQAKTLRARTRMESAALAASERDAEAGFGSMLGLSLDPPSVVEGSVPPLPKRQAASVEESRVLPRLLAFRDLVQLDYLAAYMNRLKATHDMALARTSIGGLVAAELEEAMKLAALVRFNDQVRMAKIQFESASDGLEDWALGRGHLQVGGPGASVENPIPEGVADGSAGTLRVPSPRLISLLIAPGIPELSIGKSQQYSAIATDSEGHARDVSAEARWSCSTDTGAVLSTTGLLTALSEGRLTIRVAFEGLANDRRLAITAQLDDQEGAH